MSLKQKEITRFTFDCPTDLHSIVKMKALTTKQTVKDYLVGLIVKDVSNEPPKYMSDSDFQEKLSYALKNDAPLMKKLADR